MLCLSIARIVEEASRMRRVRSVVLAILTLSAMAASLGHAQKSAPLPAVIVTLTVDITDVDGWLPMHQEVLGTLPGSPKALTVSVPVREGPPRSITLTEPKFWMTVGTARGFKLVNVYIRGKVTGPEALQTLPGFVRVLAEAGGGPFSGLRLEYGLASVIGDLVELKVEDR